MIELLSRVAWLFALVIAPRVPSPEPQGGSVAEALIGALLLVAGPLAGYGLWRRFETLESKVALWLWIAASVAVGFEAQRTLSASLPLLRGYYVAAPAVWCALAACAATLAGQYAGVAWKNKRTGAAVATLAISIFVFRDAAPYIASPEQQWTRAVIEHPDHERALLALGGATPPAALAACVSKHPNHCLCRLLRAERALDSAHPKEAAEDLDAAHCQGQAVEVRFLAARAESLALGSQFEQAEALARSVIEQQPDNRRALFAMALGASAAGATDRALSLVEHAIKAGAGRSAELLEAALLLGRSDLAAAKVALDRFALKYPDDPDAAYNLALWADKSGQYNQAREGYLRTLRLAPSYANARYNLALLTLRFGIADEARHHAAKFAEAFPEDPRVPGLLSRVR